MNLPKRLPPRILTVVLAVLGVVLFSLAGLPLPFLFGPMAACLIAALLGAPLRGLGQISVAARTILGVAVGASITPALLHQIPAIAASAALIPVYIVLIALIGAPFFNRLCGFDPMTSFYAAMPGGLQDMVIFGEAAGANVRTLSLVHATRVLIIVTLAPIFLIHVYGVSLGNPIGAPAAEIPARELALMVIAAIVGWKGGERIGLFGASILGPIIVAAAFSMAGLLHMRPPKEAILASQFFIGMGIGVYYIGVTFRELRQVVLSAIAFAILLAILAATFTEIVTLAGFANPVEAFLAYAPGGQAEMTVLAIVAGADLSFVITHHLIRIILVIVGAPIAVRLLRLRKG